MENLSYQYQKDIQQQIKPLYEDPNFAGTAVVIALHSGERYWLSSTPEATQALIESGVYRGDYLLDYNYCKHHSLIFPDDPIFEDSLSQKITTICRKYHLYRAYFITRFCEDCCVLVTYNIKKEALDCVEVYKNTIDRLESVLINYFDSALMAVYCKQLSNFKHTRFVTDKPYRDRIIKQREVITSPGKLNDAEIKTLYWLAHGKTSEDIALLLDLSVNTVNTYRRRITEKLEASNIAHAVYLAIIRNIIH